MSTPLIDFWASLLMSATVWAVQHVRSAYEKQEGKRHTTFANIFVMLKKWQMQVLNKLRDISTFQAAPSTTWQFVVWCLPSFVY